MTDTNPYARDNADFPPTNPVTDNPMLLPAHHFLDACGLPYRTLTFPPETEKGAASVARVLGFQEKQMVKTLLFTTKAGEHVMVLLPADKSAVSGHLKKALGSKNIRLAHPDVVQELTGYAIGSIPPFHWQPAGFRSFIDAALMAEDELGVGAGQWGHEIILTPENLVRAARAVVVNLTDRERSVWREDEPS